MRAPIFGLAAVALVAAAIGCGGRVKKDADAKAPTTGLRRSAGDLTDAEENTIGRAVAARIFTKYKALGDEALNAYVSRVGTVVALGSDRPQTFGGYHFEVLDGDGAYAFSAPGGLIFVSRGAISLCQDEDMLAGFLAHEVAHMALRHGVKAIAPDRLKEAFAATAGDPNQPLTGPQAAGLAKTLDGAVDDVMTALENGYGKAQELDADRLAVAYAARAGYDPGGLERFLVALQNNAAMAHGGVSDTHPGVDSRLEVVRKKIADEKLAPSSPATVRTDRFKAATGA